MGSNSTERHQENDEKNACLKKNPEDYNLTEEDLRKSLRLGSEGNEELKKLIIRTQTHEASIFGSNVHFNRKRMELESLIECKGMHALWFVLLSSGNH